MIAKRRTSTSSRNSSQRIPNSTATPRTTRNISRSNTPQLQPAAGNTPSRQTTNGTPGRSNGPTQVTKHPQHGLPFHRNNGTSSPASTTNGVRRSTRGHQAATLSKFSEDESEQSENEESEDEEESVAGEEEEEDESEDLEDEEELEDSYDEEEEDDEVQFTSRSPTAGGINLAIQTSPGLDDTVDSGNLLNGGGTRFRGQSGQSSSRFISSTPTPAVKSTSAYLSTPKHSAADVGNHSKPAFPVDSPLRRHVAGNSNAYGSLGEVLASLPMSSGGGPRSSGTTLPSTTSWSTSTPSLSGPLYSQGLSFASTPSSTNATTYPSGHPPSAMDITTQAGRGSANTQQNAMGGGPTTAAYNLNKRSTYCNSHSISKWIIVMAGIFFLTLSYKYASLRPSIDMEKLVCVDNDNGDNSDGTDLVHRKHCVPLELEHSVTNLSRALVSILETRASDVLCSPPSLAVDGSSTAVKNVNMSVTEILEKIAIDELAQHEDLIKGNNSEDEEALPKEKADLNYNEYGLKSNGFQPTASADTQNLQKIEDDEYYEGIIESISPAKGSTKDKVLKANMQLLLALIDENPQWGIQMIIQGKAKNVKKQELPVYETIVADEHEHDDVEKKNSVKEEFDFDLTFLNVVHPPIDWECWAQLWTNYLFSLILALVVYLVYAAVAFCMVYGFYRMYCWRQEKQIREQQDVFELVEQVLSMLMTQHHQLTAAGANGSPQSGTGSRPCLAVNHIRDQLIPPTVSNNSIC